MKNGCTSLLIYFIVIQKMARFHPQLTALSSVLGNVANVLFAVVIPPEKRVPDLTTQNQGVEENNASHL